MTRAWLAVAALALACDRPPPLAQTVRAVRVFDCQVTALKPYLPEAMNTAKLVEEVVKGQVELPLALLRVGNSASDMSDAVDAFNACIQDGRPGPVEMPEGAMSL